MAALLLKRLTLQTIKTENNCISRCLGKYILHKTRPAQLSLGASVPRLSYLVHAKAFSTAADTQDERKKKKKSEPAFSNIGRKIHERVIHVLDEAGNDLGNMHRADVIRLMNERDLRLVKRDSGMEPPQYQLLTGAQIHKEQLRLRELEKARPKPGRCRAVCKPSPRDHRPAVESGICQGAHDRGGVKKQGHSRSHHQCPQLQLSLISIPLLFPLMPCGQHSFPLSLCKRRGK